MITSTARIDVTKIRKDAIFAGKKGKYIDITFHENKDGPNEYGDDGFVTQSLPREMREAGEKNPIIGNWRHVQRKAPRSDPPPPPPPPQTEFEDIPF